MLVSYLHFIEHVFNRLHSFETGHNADIMCVRTNTAMKERQREEKKLQTKTLEIGGLQKRHY